MDDSKIPTDEFERLLANIKQGLDDSQNKAKMVLARISLENLYGYSERKLHDARAMSHNECRGPL